MGGESGTYPFPIDSLSGIIDTSLGAKTQPAKKTNEGLNKEA